MLPWPPTLALCGAGVGQVPGMVGWPGRAVVHWVWDRDALWPALPVPAHSQGGWAGATEG